MLESGNFFFQAEDGIRDGRVTGVQTCALPIFFKAVLLDGKNAIIRDVTVSEGSLTLSIVHPREAFVPAVRESAAAVIFVHNHPSGDPEASPEDRALTHRLVSAGEIIGIRVLDHVIIGDHEYISFADQGWLTP